MDSSITKRILFLYPYGYWPANPNCVSLVARCEQEGTPFDLFCPTAKNCRGQGREIGEWVWLVRRMLFSATKQTFRRPWKVFQIWKSVLHFYKLKQHLRHHSYSLIITCDATGLGLLSRLKFRGGVPVVYLSYHILFRHELKTLNEHFLAQRETEALPYVKLALSQDENRKHLLANELGIPPEKIQCVAVAPEERPSKVSQNSIYRDPKIVLYCGNIERWNLESILESVTNGIPKGFSLRIHTHFEPQRELYRKLMKLDEQRLLHFTFSFLNEEELVHLIDSSYIGLAPYFPQSDSWMVNQTLHHIGKASTKIAYYCMRKKPVITTELPSLSAALGKYPFGRALKDWEHIEKTICDIESNYSYYSEGAYAYYLSELSPTLGLNRFWDKIKGLIPSSSSQLPD